MKKRLRKKKHSGEFAEWGRQIIVTRNTKEGFDEFADGFVVDAIEANGCYCGGGGSGERLKMVIELGRRSDDRDGRLKRITEWLDARPDVQGYEVGKEFDLWHESPEDIEKYSRRGPFKTAGSHGLPTSV